MMPRLTLDAFSRLEHGSIILSRLGVWGGPDRPEIAIKEEHRWYDLETGDAVEPWYDDDVEVYLLVSPNQEDVSIATTLFTQGHL